MAFFIISIIWCCLTPVMGWKRVAKNGDVLLGGLFDVHVNSRSSASCDEFYPQSLGLAEAMVYAIEKINNDSKLLPNVTLGYDIRDYCYSSELAMEMAYDFVRAGDPQCHQKAVNTSDASSIQPPAVVAVIGPPDSQSSLLVTKLFGVRHIAVISPVATSVELSTPLYDNFYRTIPSDKWQTVAMADILEYFNWTYVGLVALDDSYGRNAARALHKEASTRGTFCFAFTEIVPRLGYFNELKDVVARLTKIDNNVRVVLVWLYGGFGKTFFREVNRQTISGFTWVLSDGALTGIDMYEAGSTVLDGSLAVSPNAFSDDTGFREHLKSISQQRAAHSHKLPWWEEFWREEHNCSAEDDLVHKPTSRCLPELPWRIFVGKIDSAYVPYCIDAVYSLARAVEMMYRSNQGLSDKNLANINPYLKLVDFEGLTGNVRFDEFGDPLEATYSIVNLKVSHSIREEPAMVNIGNWSKASKRLSIHSHKMIHWNPNAELFFSLPRSLCSEPCPPGTRKSVRQPHCCWSCLRCPEGTISSQVGSMDCTECGKEEKSSEDRSKCLPLPLITVTLSSTSGLVVVIIGACGLLIVLWFSFVMIKYYQSPVVKGSNRELSLVLMIVITAKIVDAILRHREPSDISCRTSLSAQYLLFNVRVSVLLLKTLRLVTIFHNPTLPTRFQRWLLDSRKQLVLLGLLQVPTFVLTVVWLGLDPPHAARLVQASSHVFLVCRHASSRPGIALLVCIGVSLVTLSVICTFYTVKARNIPENYNEAKYIGFSMYTTLLVGMVAKPLEFAMNDWYVTLISSVAALISSCALLLCMFAPKVFIISVHPEQNTVDTTRRQVAQYTFKSSVFVNRVATVHS